MRYGSKTPSSCIGLVHTAHEYGGKDVLFAWRNAWVYVLLSVSIVIACHHDEKTPSEEIHTIEPPDSVEVEHVIDQFLSREEPIPFRLWATVDGKTVANMAGTTEKNKWELEGSHDRRSFVQLAGRQNKVKWKTKNASGELEQTAFGLSSPHEHLKRLKGSFNKLAWGPESRFESDCIAVQLSLTDEKVNHAILTALGKQFATSDVIQNIVDKIDVRYTLWYNEHSHALYQVEMELVGDSTQRLIYLFGE